MSIHEGKVCIATGAVAIVDVVVDGHRSVAADREGPDVLFEIRSVVLVVAVHDLEAASGRGGLSA